ncbi:MAG: hypothetical protein R3D29_12475 [Nitratireductor sp.]
MSNRSGCLRLKQLPLHSLHAEQGAKFSPFAGFDMPLFYPAEASCASISMCARKQACSIFLVLVMLAGKDAAALVSHLCPYPADEQQTGKACYTFFLNEQAGVIDDLIVTRFAADRFMIVCNAACAEKDLAHIAPMQRDAMWQSKCWSGCFWPCKARKQRLCSRKQALMLRQ